MLIEEAEWIKRAIAQNLESDNFPLLNIGSSTGYFRKVVQAHIHQYVFLPLEEENKTVIHLDMKMDDGIDVVGDLSNPDFRNTLKDKQIKSVLCSNLLEHLADPKPICDSILSVLEPKGVVIVTVPFFFPFHKDPIDTYFRQSCDELHAYFPGTKILDSKIVVSKGSYAKDLWTNKKYMLIMLARLGLPFFRTNEWKYIAKDILNARKHYSATCLVLEKL
jgi:SAM-dependent methyltransferase